MTRRGFAPGRRLAALVAAGVLVLSLAGDRGRAATVPASVYGQDPLEVLELKVRPNVIIVLDSSGSMTLTGKSGGGDTSSGDHPASKMYQAKQVIKKVVNDNQNKVSFMFGQYSQDNSLLAFTGAGYNRFQYASSAPAAAPLIAQRARGDDAATNRGLQSWQLIYPQWNTVYFNESNGAQCAATIPGTPRFFATGASLASAMQTAMNAAACSGGSRGNTYAVSYSATTGRFSFTTSSGSNTYIFPSITGPNNIRLAAGVPTTLSGVTRLRRLTDQGRIYVPADPGFVIGDTCTVSGAVPTYFNGDWTVTREWRSTSPYIRLNGPLGTDTNASTIGAIRCLSGPYTLLYRTTGTGTTDSLAAPFANGMDTRWTLTEEVGGTTTDYYQVATSRLWNGEVIGVSSTGEVCGVSFGTPTNPPSLTLEPYDSTCGASAGAGVVFTYAGGRHGASNTCRGYNHKVDLVPCDIQSPPWPLQITNMMPTLQNESLFNADGTMVEYAERQDGSWAADTWPAATTGGARASGSTPLGNSLMDLKVEFTNLWDNGLSTGPWAGVPSGQRAIKDHRDPKEKTIVLFVTDGNDTCKTRDCALGETDLNALRAARKAELLYQRIVTDQPASSVQTYVIGYGGAFAAGEPTRLNWIAWGGSGLTGVPVTGSGDDERWDPGCSLQDPVFGCTSTSSTTCPNPGDCACTATDIANGTCATVCRPNTPTACGDGSYQSSAYYNNTSCISSYLNPKRAACRTCTDAFLAPDANKLAEQLQAIIDQGASEGDFSAQQSVTESVFEYVERIGDVDVGGTMVAADGANPTTRYRGIVPTRFVSSFTLPGFHGHVRAYQNDGSGNTLLMWDAGDKLLNLVKWGGSNAVTCSGGVCSCDTTSLGGGVGQCTFSQLGTTIKRRIYTTDRNGVYFTYPYDPTVLMGGGTENVAGGRQRLWPPTAPNLIKADYTSQGAYDVALGLPPDTPTTFPPNPVDKFCDPLDTRPTASPKKPLDQCWFEWLGKKLNACVGTATLPSACTSGTYLARMKAARREAREIALAFMAGATTIADTTGIKRTPSTGSVKNAILYQARDWVLADSEMATAGVVTPPNSSAPLATPYVEEYELLVGGAGTAPRADSDAMIRKGFGLVDPEEDATGTGVDTRTRLKPVMTVVYSPGNDMLHAFRAGPCDTAGLDASGCSETGGEELWGFVPYDQLHTVMLRAANEPQGKDNHVYSLARGVRFADVFVPGAMTGVNIGGEIIPSMKGVWRRILYFGRGIGGKYVTALDVTAPGPYTAAALTTVPPIPLWSRGNPDTQDGRVGGTRNGSANDQDAYARMGETWSMPTPAFVNPGKANPLYVTPRRQDGVDFVIFMGSGYGNPNAAVREGTTHFTLDGLSGDVIAWVDVEDAAASLSLDRTGLGYPNALVANSVGFNRSRFASAIQPQEDFVRNPHSWEFETVRVYIGDLHGRVWKFLTLSPNVAIPAADLGADQPVGTAVALLAEHIDPAQPDPKTMIPNVFTTSGAERRAAGPFRIFSLLDRGTDTSTATTGTRTSPPGPGDGATFTSILPVEPQFVRTFDQGDPFAGCASLPETVFRGTIQPTSATDCLDPLSTGGVCTGEQRTIVAFGGTRLSIPNTLFAPPTPLACGNGEYPCRSQFDTILYMLEAKTGATAYDLNASGDDAYRIFRDSRIAAISFTASVSGGGSTFVADEGLIRGTPKPPPPPGIPPTVTSSTASVILKREPGQPAPVVQYGSTVCQ